MSLSHTLRHALLEAFELKSLPRAGWLRAKVDAPESVAAHSWGVAFLALLLCPEELDRERVLAIALTHDLAEVRTGDITPHDGVSPAEKQAQEHAAIEAISDGLPRGEALRAWWQEYEEGTSPEGRFVKAMDKLDMALQAIDYQARQGVNTQEFIVSALAKLEDPRVRGIILESLHTEVDED